MLVTLLATTCFAAFDDNSTHATALQGQMQGQAQGQGQGQIAAQGQLGEVTTTDNSETKAYAVSYPALSGGEGISQANAYSLFGGLGLSNTEKYKVYITQIQAIEAISLLTQAEKTDLVKQLVNKMVKSNKTQRILGIGPETSGRNLFNLFGILSWDSFWKDGEAQE
jgi:hypothetical protein